MNDTLMFPLVPAALVMVGMALLLAGPWPVGLPVLVAGTGELVGRCSPVDKPGSTALNQR